MTDIENLKKYLKDITGIEFSLHATENVYIESFFYTYISDNEFNYMNQKLKSKNITDIKVYEGEITLEIQIKLSNVDSSYIIETRNNKIDSIIND